MSIAAKIFEQGNGFPFPGDILWDGEGNVYRLAETDGRIHTGRPAGNYIYGMLEAADDADDADAPFEARVELYAIDAAREALEDFEATR